MGKFINILMFLVTILIVSGCSKHDKIENNEIKIDNGGRVLSFEYKPRRLVTLRQHITETALEIELDPYIVGCSSVIDPPVLDHLKNRYDKLPIIAEKYPTIERLLDVNPDILWVDRKWAFVKNQLGSMKNIERQGIKVYLSESGFHNKNDIKYVYDDLSKIGYLFDKKDRANVIISEMKEKIKNIHNNVKDIDKKVRVLDYDSSRNNLAFVGCRCMADNLIHLAGGENIFSDIDKEWANVNWEEIIKRNPDVIIVHEYRGISGLSKIEELRRNPLLQDINAVKNNRFIIVNLDEIYEGVRNADTVEKLAKGFYPERF